MFKYLPPKQNECVHLQTETAYCRSMTETYMENESVPTFTVQESRLEIPMKEYMEGFRDFSRVRGYCHDCGRYGKCWACPPYSFDEEEFLEQYTRIELIASRITPAAGISLTPEISGKLIKKARTELDRMLLLSEEQEDGSRLRAFFAGTCIICPPGQCTRIDGRPCRYPHMVRPSLEAVGFDVARTSEELLGIRMQWGKNGQCPDYLVLVSALAGR